MRKPNTLAEVPRDARVKDLPYWYELYGFCFRCGHYGKIEMREMLRKFGTQTIIIGLEPRLRCTKCKSLNESQFGVAKMPR